MKGPLVRNGLGALLVGALLCPLHLNAQFVYVNDNNALSNALIKHSSSEPPRKGSAAIEPATPITADDIHTFKSPSR